MEGTTLQPNEPGAPDLDARVRGRATSRMMGLLIAAAIVLAVAGVFGVVLGIHERKPSNKAMQTDAASPRR